ncbi:MAG: DUF1848 domain-containing protein [Caldilineaceae bacterium]|nr:DUF1848 domain-containing protein [Caldilineaceae bacterium]
MIISASRRTDIPAFYAPWLMNRIRAGYCAVPNPFNRSQVSRISLRPQDVDVIAFWTRNPRPLLPALDELDARGYRYYFQYTLLDNPRALDPKSPPVDAAIATFRALAERIGPARVIWRYDPIVLSSATGADFHLERYAHIAGELRGCTTRSVISVMDRYRKIERRLAALAAQGIALLGPPADQTPDFARLMTGLAGIAADNGMEIQSCAEELDLARYCIAPGKCIDDAYIARVFGLQLDVKKDPSQRAACGCVASRDIGMYDSCLFGCQYCYATSSFARAAVNHVAHDPAGEALVG